MSGEGSSELPGVTEGEDANQTIPPESATEEPEMVAPEVNQVLLEQMVEMGFPKNRAVRALFFTSADVVDQAITWLTENEDDPELDDELLVKKKKQMNPEEMKEHLEGLRIAAKARREKEEKELEVHKEKERVRVGREMMAAKRIEDDNARKRLIDERKREKAEEKLARDKIRVKLDEDKRARRRKLGLPEEPTEEELQKKKEREEQKALEKAQAQGMSIRNVVKPVGQLEVLRRRLVEMKQGGDEEAFKGACGLLLKYLGNIARAPQEEKFRNIRLSNATFVSKVASVEGAVGFLEGCGFDVDEAGEFLAMKSENVDLELLNGAGAAINSAMTNPFFGVL